MMEAEQSEDGEGFIPIAAYLGCNKTDLVDNKRLTTTEPMLRPV